MHPVSIMRLKMSIFLAFDKGETANRSTDGPTDGQTLIEMQGSIEYASYNIYMVNNIDFSLFFINASRIYSMDR